MYLHPTMYLLIRNPVQQYSFLKTSLHPTMYLLILNASTIIAHCYCPLHPTMYLLIPVYNINQLACILLYIPLCIY